MSAPYKFILNKQTLWLSPERCILWEDQRALILSDLHFGKSGHFRKSGIAIPQNVFKEDLQRLFAQIQFFNPDQLLIVGDFFHSSLNKEIDMFLKWRNDLSHLKDEAEENGEKHIAAQLQGNAESSELTEELRKDDHLKKFLDLPVRTTVLTLKV